MFANLLRKLTLSFENSAIEAAYNQDCLAQLRFNSRIAISVGLIVYICYGILDFWFVQAEERQTLWLIRILAITPSFATILFTYHPFFTQVNRLALGLVGLYAGISIMGVLWVLPVQTTVYYYPGLVLVTFFTYNFVGTRFIYALIIDLAMLLLYNLIFGYIKHFPVHLLLNHDYFIISANLIGGCAGYINEYQRRQLFHQRLELFQQKEIHHRNSLHDSLTELPNRELLMDRVNQAISASERNAPGGAGYYIDLDGFKPINDNLGHATGDQVLKEVARRLQFVVRESDTVSRLGGDEFFILARDVTSLQDAKMLADKILRALAEPPILDAIEPNSLNASIGICLFPYPNCSANDFINRADKAMYHSKRSDKARFSVASAELEGAHS